MNNYLNIQANKKHLVTKITTRENYFANKNIFNKMKRISSNLKKVKYTNNNKENYNQNTLTDICSLSLQQDINSLNSDRPLKTFIYEKKDKYEKEKIKEKKKTKLLRNSCNNNNAQNLIKKKIPHIKDPKKNISSIPLFKNYMQKTFSSKNTERNSKNKKITIDKRTLSIYDGNKTFTNNVHSNINKNSVFFNTNNCNECNFKPKEKIKSADVSPKKNRNESLKFLSKNNIKNKIEEKYNVKNNNKNNSMIVGQNKKKRGVIKLSINNYENKNKDKEKNSKRSCPSTKTSNLPLKKNIINKNPQMVDEYFDEIYKYLKSIENSDLPKENYMNSVQDDINEKMRKILLDWLIDVHAKFNLLTETLFLSINIIDRFLSKQSINRKYLQLLGVTSMFLASKYEDIYPPEMKDFLFMTDNAYTAEEMVKMESDILDKIEFNMTYPTSLRFLEIFKKILNLKEIDFFRCKYFLEIGLFDYKCCHFSPSLIAATSIFLNYKINKFKYKDIKLSENKILKSVQYDLKEMTPCLNCLINAIKKMIEVGNKFTAIKRKFEKEEFMKVSKEKIDINKIF